MQDNMSIIRNMQKDEPDLYDDLIRLREARMYLTQDIEAPLVSIIVVAYNHVKEYTQRCIQCLLKYTTNITFEMILIDNGSTDETLEFFNEILYERKRIIHFDKNIGCSAAFTEGIKQCSGKYIVMLCNDVLVTKNWLDNMVKCIESDITIGSVSPQSDRVSSRQNVDLKYADFEEMQLKAAQYNVSDDKKWDERIRVVILATLFRKSCIDIVGGMDYGFIHDSADNDLSFRIRRAGYKNILCKDVFVSHIGRTKDKGEDLAKTSLAKGRKDFYIKYNGINIKTDCDNYENEMMRHLEKDEMRQDKKYKVLGIDVKCGTPLLEIKNYLKHKDIKEVELSAFSSEAKYWLDLITVCRENVIIDEVKNIKKYFKDKKFSYIIIGDALEGYAKYENFIKACIDKLEVGGKCLFKIGEEENKKIKKVLKRLEKKEIKYMEEENIVILQKL